MTFRVDCGCGKSFHVVGVESRIAAEVAADRHEASDVRRPYRHDTKIVEEVAR